MLAGILHERRHTYEISEFGGLAATMPIFAASFLFIVLASGGLPLLNGFIGEFLVLSGAFQSNAWYGVLGATGVIWSACYLLWMYQRVFYGEPTNEKNRTVPDLDAREKLVLVVMVAVIIGMGIYPQPFLRRLDANVKGLMYRVHTHAVVTADRGPIGHAGGGR